MVGVEDKEVWKNATRGDVYITKRNLHGKIGSERVAPGSSVTISTEERMINQESAATAGLDLFSNGTLAVVSLSDSVADYEEVASNPNSMSDDELRNLFELSASEFKKSVAEIQNTKVIERLTSIADEPKVKASLAQSKALGKRLEELTPEKKNFADATGDIPVKDLS